MPPRPLGRRFSKGDDITPPRDTDETLVLSPEEDAPDDAPEAPARETDARPPKLADGIELIGVYEGSGFKDPPYIARRSDGQMVQMAQLLYLVAEEIDGAKTYGEIGERVSEKFGRGLDGEMTQMLVEEKLRPLGVVATPDGEADAELKKIDPLLALKFKAAVVPEWLVNSITTVFRPLFFPPVVIAVLAGLAAMDVWLFGYHGVAQSLRQTLYDPLFILLMLGLVVLSAAFHECGHATACRYGGARPGVMGVGLYIVWPAFYTDVTDAYRLDKKGRLRTDLGGVYFNTIFILLTAGAYFATGFEPLLLIIPLQHIEILHQFLPFLRLDGYYIVSDLTGVPDMFARIKPILKSLVPFTTTEDSVKELKPWARVAMTVYVLTLVPALAFMLGMTVMNMPRIFATAYDSFMLTAHKLGHAGGISMIVDGIQLVVLLMVPLGIVITFFQLGRKALAGAWNSTDGRPAMRGMLVATSGAVAAFAAYTWAPAAVYRPIQPQERGTLAGAVGEIKAIPSGRPALPAQRARQLGGAPLRSKQHSATSPAPARPGAGTSTSPGATTSTPTATSTTPGASPAQTATAPAAETTTQPAATQPAATQPAATTPAQTTTTDTTTTATTTTTTTTTTTP